MLHGAGWLREHDIAQAGIVGRGGAVGDGEVAPRVVAGQEDGDVVDLGGTVLGVGGKGEAAVGGDVEGDFDEVWRVLGGVCDCEGGERQRQTSAEGCARLWGIHNNQARRVDLAVSNGEVDGRCHAGSEQQRRARVCGQGFGHCANTKHTARWINAACVEIQRLM